MGLVYHIATPGDWEDARAKGEYRISTRGRTLEEQGYIHAATAAQVSPVANAIYGADDDLVVLVIDTERLTSRVVLEPVPGWDAPFPHIYGPINVDSVVDTQPLTREPAGYVWRVP